MRTVITDNPVEKLELFISGERSALIQRDKIEEKYKVIILNKEERAKVKSLL